MLKAFKSTLQILVAVALVLHDHHDHHDHDDPGIDVHVHE